MKTGPRVRPARTLSCKRIEPIALVAAVCQLIGSDFVVTQLRHELDGAGICRAVRDSNTPALFDWLMGHFSFQGISDAVVQSYVAKHGNISYQQIASALSKVGVSCRKLMNFSSYHGCRYRKTTRTCASPDLIGSCPVPAQNLRNGNLSQLAHSLFLFLRDVCKDDLVGFIDQILAKADIPGHPERLPRMRRALLDAFTAVHGVSEKILSMTFADLLMGADPERPRWFDVGASMIAVDTLVHNFLHRTGILTVLGADHRYGATCYREHGCAGVIDWLARRIDARTFNPALPAYFPRFIQYAIWAFCAQQHRNVCNGNQIDDTTRCLQRDCPVYRQCGRVKLHSALSPSPTHKQPTAARAPP